MFMASLPLNPTFLSHSGNKPWMAATSTGHDQDQFEPHFFEALSPEAHHFKLKRPG
jgi:hypothetical protein